LGCRLELLKTIHTHNQEKSRPDSDTWYAGMLVCWSIELIDVAGPISIHNFSN